MDMLETLIEGEPDPDTLPEPYFAGLTWEQIKGELLRLEQEQWEQDQLEHEAMRGFWGYYE